MRKIEVSELRPGMVLGQSLFNARGDTLLSRNVALSQEYVDAIKARGFLNVYVQDGVEDSIAGGEMVTAKIRHLSCHHLGQLFDLAEKMEAVLADGNTDREQVLDQFAEEARGDFDRLSGNVDKFVNEVSKARVLPGIVSLKSYDNYTFEHSVEVTVAALVLGEQLYLSEWDLRQLALGCLCHDLGKLVVPKAVLNKPGRLLPEEFDVIKTHPQEGYHIVQKLTERSDILARGVVRQHHERQDGTGYPRGLRGSNRLCGSRPIVGQGLMLQVAEIAAVADVYSAISSDRPYRRAMTPQGVSSTMLQMSGTVLNKEITRRFLGLIPTFPVGTQVEVVSGRLKGYRGVVSSVKPGKLSRPTVRLLFDHNGRRAATFEVDTGTERDLELVAITSRAARAEAESPARLAAGRA